MKPLVMVKMSQATTALNGFIGSRIPIPPLSEEPSHHVFVNSEIPTTDQKASILGLKLVVSGSTSGSLLGFRSFANVNMNLPQEETELSSSPGSNSEQSRTWALHDSLRILMVDDNSFSRKIGTILLENMGHQVDVASNGEAALHRLGAQRYDLVLMDLQMPEMDGIETTIRIRQATGTGRLIPIIALTGQASDFDRIRGKIAGMDNYLTKPLREPELRRVLEDARRSADPTESPQENPWSLDPENILDAFPMKRETMVLVVQMFRESCIERLGQIQGAIKREDRAAIVSNTHALKGSLGMFATQRAIGLVNALEASGNLGDFCQAKCHLLELEFAIGQLQPTLDRLSVIPKVTP